MAQHQSISIGMTLLLSVAATTAGAGQDGRFGTERPTPPTASLTQQVLLATYPELRDRPIAWRLTGRDRTLVVEAREAVPPVLAASPATDGATAGRLAAPVAGADAPLVRAVVELDDDGGLLAVRTDGRLPRPAALLAAQASASPVDALQSIETALPPADSSTPGAIVSARLAGVLGATTVQPGVFRAQAVGSEEPLTWLVDMESSASGTARFYTLTFEPVEGRLLAVVRR
jgi:hypothetical protein